MAELINDIDQISQDAQTGMARKKEDELRKLDAIAETAKQRRWDRRGDVLASLGKAYGELREMAKACEYYQKALDAERGTVSLRVIEQLANLQVREAIINREPSADYAAICRRALESLDALVKLAGESVERLNLRGACCKRQAQVLAADDRTAALQEMANWYGKAEKRARDNGRPDPYPMLMCVSARIAAEVRHPSRGPILNSKFGRLLNEAERKSVEDDNEAPNFWSSVSAADAVLLRALAKGRLDEDARKIIGDAYLKRWTRGGSWLKFQSVLEQIQFFIDVWDDGDDATRQKRDDLRNGLTILYDTIEARISAGSSPPPS
jgi:hypothetical protein